MCLTAMPIAYCLVQTENVTSFTSYLNLISDNQALAPKSFPSHWPSLVLKNSVQLYSTLHPFLFVIIGTHQSRTGNITRNLDRNYKVPGFYRESTTFTQHIFLTHMPCTYIKNHNTALGKQGHPLPKIKGTWF